MPGSQLSHSLVSCLPMLAPYITLVICSWTYNNAVHAGTCRTGFWPTIPPDLDNSTRWCIVDPGCDTLNQVGGI